MLILKEMTASDLPIFGKWLYEPHVAKWYRHPLNWIDEVKKQDAEFNRIHHYIAEYDGVPVGFCQYYACLDSDELFGGYTAMGGSYSIDYMIGDPVWLRKGLGRQIVAKLTAVISSCTDAKRVVVEPDCGNAASCGLLIACGSII